MATTNVARTEERVAVRQSISTNKKKRISLSLQRLAFKPNVRTRETSFSALRNLPTRSDGGPARQPAVFSWSGLAPRSRSQSEGARRAFSFLSQLRRSQSCSERVVTNTGEEDET